MKQNKKIYHSGSAKLIISSNNFRSLQSARSLMSISTIGKGQPTIDNTNPSISNLLMSSEGPKQSFNDYSTHLNESLAAYHGVDPDKLFKNMEQLPIIQAKEPFIPKKEKEKVKQLIRFNKVNKIIRNGEKKDTKIHIMINEDYKDTKYDYSTQVYSSPFQSLRVLRKNHQIYDEINKSFLERQKQCFDESVEIVEGMTMKYKVKMPKIRVIQMISKGFYDDPSSRKKSKPKDKEEDDNNDNDEKETKDKKKPKLFEGIKQKPFEYKLYSFFKYPNKNFPEGREQFSISLYNNRILLFGGMSSTIKSTIIWSLNLESLEWTKINAKTIVPYLRYGHTSVCIGNKLYIYGGRIKFINSTEYADHDMFNLETNTWIVPQFQSKRKPSTRRNHIGEIVGNNYVIHGGMGFDGELLNDVFILNFNPLKWSPAHVSEHTPGPYLYGHTSCLVVPYDIRFSPRLNAYRFPESRHNLYEKGLYIFGGHSKDDGISNELYILTIGKSVLEWKLVDAKGKKPLPRYFHSMNFYEKGHYIIIHGGRNDFRSDSFALNDTHIFSLTKLEWHEIILYSNSSDFRVLTRCGHSSVIYSNKLVIFGGMNCNNYLGSSLFVINLNFEYDGSVKTVEEILRKKFINNYAIVKEDKNMFMKYQNLMSKNQLEILPEYSLPAIK